MGKKRIGVWIDDYNIEAADTIAKTTGVSRSRVINTMIEDTVASINKQIDEGSDDWKRKQWH